MNIKRLSLLVLILIHSVTFAGFSVDGKMGVGVTTPTQSLDVNGGVNIGDTSIDSAGAMRFRGSSFEGYNGSSWVPLNGSAVVDSSNIWQANEERTQTYTSDGYKKVGIDKAPNYTLDVNGTVNATAFIGDGSNITGLGAKVSPTANDFLNALYGVSSVNANGQIGIGTDPQADTLLRVNGTAVIGSGPSAPEDRTARSLTLTRRFDGYPIASLGFDPASTYRGDFDFSGDSGQR